MKKSLVIRTLAGTLALPLSALAIQTGIAFGGLIVGTPIPCTCSPQLGMAITYAPLFNNSEVPTTGLIYYPLSALLYAYFEIGVPGTWDLGTYTPGGAGVEQCLTGVPPACTVVPTLGAIQYTGTSALPPIPWLTLP